MTKTGFFLITVLILLSSCSARITTSIQKSYEPIARSQEVKVMNSLTEVPQGAELLGKVDVGDSGFTTNCSYDTVLNAAILEARKAGGNAICITDHLTPDFHSSCHRISANIYKIDFHLVKTVTQAADSNTIQNKAVEHATVVKDTLEIIRKSLGYQYKYKGEILTLSQIGTILEKNTASAELYKSAKSSSGILNVLSFAGGFCIGYGLAPVLYGKQPDLALAGIGCGIIAVTIPITRSAENKLKRGVDIYNSNRTQAMVTPVQYEIKLAMIPNGIGVAFQF
jgi:hypothetical protein